MKRAGVSLPRLVVVTRKTPIEELKARHGTLGQAKFFLSASKQRVDWFEQADGQLQEGLVQILAALPADRRRTRVDRDEVDRFVFEPSDIVLAVGQDGLVANVAKYLDGQVLIGVNPDPARVGGVLCRVRPDRVAAAVRWAESAQGSGFREEQRVLARVDREDGQSLLALNEVFIGHASHQSARYILRAGRKEERQSSSGILCITGTGATGWGHSIAQQRSDHVAFPAPEEAALTWLVREPFPSVSTGTNLQTGGIAEGGSLVVVSEMGERGVIFADGMEGDVLEFTSGQVATVTVAARRLRLVVPLG
jgi:NAD kinase